MSHNQYSEHNTELQVWGTEKKNEYMTKSQAWAQGTQITMNGTCTDTQMAIRNDSEQQRATAHYIRLQFKHSRTKQSITITPTWQHHGYCIGRHTHFHPEQTFIQQTVMTHGKYRHALLCDQSITKQTCNDNAVDKNTEGDTNRTTDIVHKFEEQQKIFSLYLSHRHLVVASSNRTKTISRNTNTSIFAKGSHCVWIIMQHYM